MKKKAILLASMGVLACTVGVTALAVNGINQLNNLQVKAETKEYSVTFTESNTTIEAVNYNYAIYRTTPRGAKVGVVGWANYETDFTFAGYSFGYLRLCEYNDLETLGAYGFANITGFAISFEGGYLAFDGGDTYIDDVVSGEEYKGLSITSDDSPGFNGDNVTVTSLTIWYSC